MQLKSRLRNWNPKSLEITTALLEMKWVPSDGKKAAAPESIYNLFEMPPSTIERPSRHCIKFTRIAVVVLDQKVRPFTVKWYVRLLAGALDDAARRARRAELGDLQTGLRNFTDLLSDDAAVEDLTNLEAVLRHG